MKDKLQREAKGDVQISLLGTLPVTEREYAILGMGLGRESSTMVGHFRILKKQIKES